MLSDFLGLGLSLLLSAVHAAGDAPAMSAWPRTLFSAMANAKGAPPEFHSAERAVSNWRHEALWNVPLSAHAIWQLAIKKDPDGISRCVKLNNYWCIKKARWNGEIASDAEGHVAFASALEGATVAALLLRRYYVDYNRHSAYAIVSRWAPSQCGGMPVVARPTRLRVAGAVNSAALREVAPHGIQNTLRARWLAGAGRGGVAKRGRASPLRRSIIADPLLRMMPAPEIAVGSGERDIKLKPFAFTFASLGVSAVLPLPPMSSCISDGPRIQAYAQHVAEGVAANANEDLHLFDADGTPTANLARVMANMAAVEIGPLSARGWLVEAGIAAALRQSLASRPQPETAAAKP